MTIDSSAEAPVDVKAVWEAEGKFYTLRLKGMGRIDADTQTEEIYSAYDYNYMPVRDTSYRFTVNIEDSFTIQESEKDPRERRVSANLEKINLETLKVLMTARGVPDDASIEIDPFDGGNLVTFKWKEL